MKVLLFIMSIAVSGMSFASPGNNGFGIKEIPEKNILVVHYNAQRHIAIYFGELVAYYNKSKTPFEVVFPQMTIEYSQYNKWVAIEYRGNAKESDVVKIKKLPSTTVAFKTVKGSYGDLAKKIGSFTRELYKSKQFPDQSLPVRLLYLNSPDDNLPNNLVTEIQIPLIKK